MKYLPRIENSPEHLEHRQDIRLRLLLCAEDLRIRYGARVCLCGSGLFQEEPKDWDIRVVLDNSTYDGHGHAYWNFESAIRTKEQRQINHLNFDIRIFPSRLWYDTLSLDLTKTHRYVQDAAPVESGVEDIQEIERSKSIIDQNKDKPEFHVFLGSLIFLKGDKATALQAFLRAMQIDPTFAPAWLNVGNVYYDAGEFQRAITYYQRAMELNPDYSKAYVNAANTLVQLNVHLSALPFYDRALELEPSSAAYHNKANCLVHLKHFVDAEEALCKAIELEPADERVLDTLGNLRSNQGLDYAAASAYKLAIDVAPKYAPLYTNLANIYANLGLTELAILNYERGLILAPDNPGVRYNLALSYLRAGKYRLGWKAYEGRWGFHELSVKKRDFKQPQWIGSSLGGKRILIHAEQGLGDTFQFCRYIPLVAARGGELLFEVQPGLERLMMRVDGVSKVYTRGQELPEFDIHCPLLSLPSVFKTDIDTVPGCFPYVTPWGWEVEEMWQRYPQTGKMRIGIFWAGNPKYKKDKDRSFSLMEFAPLMSISGVEFYSLQKGSGTRQIEKYKDQVKVIDASSDARDFAESAALIETLDLVICSDSSPMHLAAAMGKEVWLLLSYLPDWRWMLNTDKTPWYPHVNIFRQTSTGDWAGVFCRVLAALQDRMKVV